MVNRRHPLSGFAALLACLLISAHVSAEPCRSPDRLSRVTGDGECLIVKTVNNGPGEADPTLFVLLHGNHSDGSPAVSMYRIAESLIARAPPNSIAVAMIRPGYNDAEGNRSSGNEGGRADNFTAANIDIVAAAIAELKDFHHARRLYLLGHSGGAAIAGVILGRHPGLADGAVLLGSPCDVPAWRAMRSGFWISESPNTYVDRIPMAARVVVAVGEDDTTTPPSLSRAYYEQIKARGLTQSELVLIPDANHLSELRAPQVIDALLNLAR